MFEFRTPAYFIRDPEVIKQIAIKDFDSFPDHRALFDENVEPLFAKGVFGLKGKKWKGLLFKLINSYHFVNIILLQICAQHCHQLLLVSTSIENVNLFSVLITVHLN